MRKVVSYSIEEELIAQVKARALEEEKTASRLVEVMIEEGLAEREKQDKVVAPLPAGPALTDGI